jgi:glycosyltransferase involved in cell wall biosynthesis
VDLITEGANGYVVDGSSTDELADRIQGLVVDSSLRRAFGSRSAAIIGQWSLAKTADGIIEAAKSEA